LKIKTGLIQQEVFCTFQSFGRKFPVGPGMLGSAYNPSTQGLRSICAIYSDTLREGGIRKVREGGKKEKKGKKERKKRGEGRSIREKKKDRERKSEGKKEGGREREGEGGEGVIGRERERERERI
jgi:hypothetical protein